MLFQNWAYDDWYVLKTFFCNSMVLFDISCVVLLICSWYLLKVSAFFSKTLLLSVWNLFTFSLIFSVVSDTLDAVSLICCFCWSTYLSVDSLNWLVFSFIWHNRFRKLFTRYEKKDENYLGLVQLANSLIVYRRIILG